MYGIYLLLIPFLFLHAFSASGSLFDEEIYGLIPVNFQGRYRPLESYANSVFFDFYHAKKIQNKDKDAFNVGSINPTQFLLHLHFFGYEGFKDAPLFYIGNKNLRKRWNLTSQNPHLSYQALKSKLLEEYSANDQNEIQALKDKAKLLESFKGYVKEFPLIIQTEIPLHQQLSVIQDPLKMIPGKYRPGEWYSLFTLGSDSDQGIPNFTLYSGEIFGILRSHFQNTLLFLKNARGQNEINKLGIKLLEAYTSLAGKDQPLSKASWVHYPTLTQLHAERFYERTPLILFSIGLYLTALLLFLLYQAFPKKGLYSLALLSFITGFLTHGLALALRSYILNRPPVSNMQETVIYVPWIANCLSLFFLWFYKNEIMVIASLILSTILLTLMEYTYSLAGFENVPAVLNSQFWLTIHVLMIVGSYGILILGGLLGHYYLIGTLFNRTAVSLTTVAKLLLQTLYCGVALLIPGTLLGGIWAAQSWGRFWDWDPKESWAFISACLYLVVIHSYRFKLISDFGLAIGSIVGLTAISFTWYGVNYILGTGLHTYGFGAGGEWIYFSFLFVEFLFILAICLKSPLKS